MAEEIKLYKSIESFIDNNCSHKKIAPFLVNFSQLNEASKTFPIIYDKNNYIQCILKVPKNEESIINDKKKKETKILVNDSSFELVLYKNDNDHNLIKCLFIIIINDIKSSEEEAIECEENILNINEDENLNDRLKLFLFDLIKSNKKLSDTFISNNINILDKILFKDNVDNIKFFNIDNKNIITDENKKDILKIKTIQSNVEIKEKNDIDNEKIISYALDELNPYYKNDLMDEYYDEMPEELNDLLKKYKKVNINNEMYLNYIHSKDGEKKENSENDEDEKDEKEDKEEPKKGKKGEKKQKKSNNKEKKSVNKSNKKDKEKEKIKMKI